MHIFDYGFLDDGLLPAELVNLISTISALNAIAEERRGRNLSIYTEMEKIARIQSVEIGTQVPIKNAVNRTKDARKSA